MKKTCVAGGDVAGIFFLVPHAVGCPYPVQVLLLVMLMDPGPRAVW